MKPRSKATAASIVDPGLEKPLLHLHAANNADSFWDAVQDVIEAALPTCFIGLTLQHNPISPRIAKSTQKLTDSFFPVTAIEKHFNRLVQPPSRGRIFSLNSKACAGPRKRFSNNGWLLVASGAAHEARTAFGAFGVRSAQQSRDRRREWLESRNREKASPLYFLQAGSSQSQPIDCANAITNCQDGALPRGTIWATISRISLAYVGMVIRSRLVPLHLGWSFRACSDAGTRQNPPGERSTSVQRSDPVRQQTIANWPCDEMSRDAVRFHFWTSNNFCLTRSSPCGSTSFGATSLKSMH